MQNHFSPALRLVVLPQLHFASIIVATIEQIGAAGIFLIRCCRGLMQRPFRAAKLSFEVYAIGWQSLAIILFTGAFTGMVLGLQGYYVLKRFGADGFLGSLIAKSLLAELAPVLSSLLIIGRAGSALCAEIGVMRLTEQIEALECLAIDIYNYLIAPKLLAMLIVLPLLVFVFTVSGMLGGYFSGCIVLGVNAGDYYQSMRDMIDFATVRMALVKALVFAIFILTVTAFRGLYVHRYSGRGALALSRTTTVAVVISSVGVLMLDYLLTAVLI